MKGEAWLRVDKRGRIVIPLRFRRALALKDGDRIVFRLNDGDLLLNVQRREPNRLEKLTTRNTAI